MNDQDLRDCFAMFAMNGYMSKLSCNPSARGGICESGKFADNNAEAVAKASYIIADAMLEARKPEPEIGLPAIKRRKAK
jgi:hypothetical protein